MVRTVEMSEACSIGNHEQCRRQTGPLRDGDSPCGCECGHMRRAPADTQDGSMLEVGWPAVTATRAAEDLLALLAPACSRIVIAGSLRRRKQRVKDVELLCVPQTSAAPVQLEQPMLFGDPPTETRDLLHDRILELVDSGELAYRLDARGRQTFGPSNKYMIHVPTGVPIDIFSTTMRDWGMALFVRTGPKEFNIRAMQRFHDLGLRGHAYGSVTARDGTRLDCHHEEDVFRLLHWTYLDPQQRFPLK